MKGRGLVFFSALGIILGIFVLVTTITGALWFMPDTEVRVPEKWEVLQFVASPQEYPIRLRIPAVNIHAFVQHVGVNAKGNMAAPNNFTDVGWYKYGTVPGYQGSAVITGHVDNALGMPGVFKNLGRVSIGDEIFVEDKNSAERRFRVVEIQKYPYTRVPLKILFSRIDASRLNLVTCSGTWLSGERSYDERLVVYAELEGG